MAHSVCHKFWDAGRVWEIMWLPPSADTSLLLGAQICSGHVTFLEAYKGLLFALR